MAVVAAVPARVQEPAGAPTPGRPTERDVLVTGGWIFTSTADKRIRNPGILVRAGKLLRVGGDLSIASPDAEQVTLAANETVLPGFFDLHAHYSTMITPRAARVDEMKAYPELFIANGVTSTFPAGESDPMGMRDLRISIDNGARVGPRIMNSGPYFGTARRGWNSATSVADVKAQVDKWAALGIKGIKTKGINPTMLRAVIEEAHLHGLTVTGHLDSGARTSVNPRDAILMGIDRIEHFTGGDAFSPDRSAYASYEHMTFDTPEFRKIVQLYRTHHTNYDATVSAYGYWGLKDPKVYDYFTDEKRFLTPYARHLVDTTKRPVNQQFENIYWTKQKEIKAFYDAGMGDLITLGTDHPSWGEYFTPFGASREMLVMTLAGIPNAAVLKIATINSARAMGVGDQLGTIEPGKLADLVIVRGDPLTDIKAVRLPRLVIKAGRVYHPEALMKSVEGLIGPTGPDDKKWFMPPQPGPDEFPQQ
ncbi:amidohydrolase family protein [Sphingomonas quercus]|uniref:Amidohydrolase family protein n=1 Tax=Sphingomonas quercus TaxID=2842451 RepID=A0ABS6BH98_9SPHN|nr:amidohydrolase family protein [Sphingomonas quercus]MBU3076836.1 amidohydrolase family protein [Sphingomonas quercus]